MISYLIMSSHSFSTDLLFRFALEIKEYNIDDVS